MKSYSEKQLTRNRLLFYGVIILLSLVSFFLMYHGIKHISINLISISLIIGTVFGLFLVYFFKFIDKRFRILMDKITEKIRIAKLGYDGEKLAFIELKRIFVEKDGYKIYCNYKIPNQKFDIDAIVIGIKGLFVFEVKNPHQKIYFQKSRTMTKNLETDEQWRQIHPTKDPIQKTRWHVQKIKEYLNNNKIFIKTAIIIIDEAKCRVYEDYDSGDISIIRGLSKLEEYVKKIPNDSLFTPEFIEELARVLTSSSTSSITR